MTTKLYKKDHLKVIDGHIVAPDGSVIGINVAIITQLNDLETRYQKAKWLETQPAACEGPNYDEFVRIHKDDVKGFAFQTDTPLMDKAIEESIALMEEIDHANVVEDLNTHLDEFSELLKWCDSDTTFGSDDPVMVIDAPCISEDYNDILHLTTDDIRDILLDVYKPALEQLGYDVSVKEEGENGEPEQG